MTQKNKTLFGRRCPICKNVLSSTLYEGQSVEECPSCHGYLVNRMKFRLIQRQDIIPLGLLKKEALKYHTSSSKNIIYCPRCRSTMRKITVSTPLAYQYDHCKCCDSIWLDGGELALDQLLFQFGLVGSNLKEIKERAQQLGQKPEQLKEFESLWAQLPNSFYEESAEAEVMEQATLALGRFLIETASNSWNKKNHTTNERKQH